MVAGQRPDAVGAQEFVLVEHARQNAAQPFRIDQRRDAAIGIPEMAGPGRMDALAQFGHAPQRSCRMLHQLGHPLALPRLDDGGGAERQQPDHGAHLEPRGAAIGQAQDIVVEPVLLVPHAVRPDRDSSRGRSSRNCSANLRRHVFVGRVVRRQLDADLEHVLAEQRHPRRAVGLLEMAAGRQRRAAVEDADVVQAQEAALEDVLAEAVLAVHPPAEVQRQLAEDRLRNSRSPSPRSACSVRYRKIVAQACTGGLTSLKFHS